MMPVGVNKTAKSFRVFWTKTEGEPDCEGTLKVVSISRNLSFLKQAESHCLGFQGRREFARKGVR